MKYLVIYKEDDSYEVILDSKKDFNNWLKEHNKEREDDGETPEEKNEFEVVAISYYQPKN